MREHQRTLAVYTSAHELVEAIEAVRCSDAKILEVCSPIPLPELEELLPHRPSPVRWFTLVGCLTGAAFGFWLQIYSVLSWPIPVGGKPIVSMSAFVIIAFELAILFGALATFAGFLLTSRLPRLETDGYHSGCSQNEFALVVRHSSLDSESIAVLLKQKGAREVKPLAEKEPE